MREVKLPTLASLDNYSQGPTAGFPTKIAPPTANLTNGKIPGEGFGAQWQNYIEAAVQRQLERNAQLPFRNFIDLRQLDSSTVLTATSRLAFSRWAGATLAATGANNAVYYYQEILETTGGPPSPLSITLAPALGTFLAKDVVEVPTPATTGVKPWLVVGTNATAPTKTIWEIGRDNSKTEITSPVSGSVELITRDRTTGIFYAFAADTNRSVLVRNNGTGVWTVLGTRGAGAPAPTVASMYATANNGVIGLAYTSGANAVVERITASGFSVVANTIESINSTVLDLRWSPQQQVFMLLTTARTWVSTDLSIATWSLANNGSGAMTQTAIPATGGCLHDSGLAIWHNDGSPTWGVGGGSYLMVQDYLNQDPHVVSFGAYSGTASTGVVMRFDGSAIWFVLDRSGTKRTYRSLRS